MLLTHEEVNHGMDRARICLVRFPFSTGQSVQSFVSFSQDENILLVLDLEQSTLDANIKQFILKKSESSQDLTPYKEFVGCLFVGFYGAGESVQ